MMLNQRLQTFSTKNIKILQISLLLSALWFFFWAHIYEMVFWNKTFTESIASSTLNVILYSTSITALIASEIYTRFSRQSPTESSFTISVDYLTKENESLKKELKKYKNFPSNKIGIILLSTGIILILGVHKPFKLCSPF